MIIKNQNKPTDKTSLKCLARGLSLLFLRVFLSNADSTGDSGEVYSVRSLTPYWGYCWKRKIITGLVCGVVFRDGAERQTLASGWPLCRLPVAYCFLQIAFVSKGNMWFITIVDMSWI